MATRRRFIRNCSALAASAAFLPASVLAVRTGRSVSLEDIAFGTLAAQVHSRFLLRDTNGDSQSLKLIEAKLASGGGSVAGDQGIERFSLLFQGDAANPLGQNTYSFEHARLGRFEMFIVPIGREDRNHCHYEAVFNRPPPESTANKQHIA